jgi:hypothetical protein
VGEATIEPCSSEERSININAERLTISLQRPRYVDRAIARRQASLVRLKLSETYSGAEEIAGCPGVASSRTNEAD